MKNSKTLKFYLVIYGYNEYFYFMTEYMKPLEQLWIILIIQMSNYKGIEIPFQL